MFPEIEPSEVGFTGLVWLFFSYGYVLYFASNLISEGSELLLLVPSMAGLVGGVVLPLLGAVPDGALILFSGLGSLEEAQESLSVGVGALAGSTIMLLTIPWSLSVLGGRVNLGPDGLPDYLKKPKLNKEVSFFKQLGSTGVTLSDHVKHGGVLMVLTTIPYFLIQVPALFLHGENEEIAAGEHWWALGGLVICLTGLVIYMSMQLRLSREGDDRLKRMAVMKKMLKEGRVSLSGAVASQLRQAEKESSETPSEYQSIENRDPRYPPPAIAAMLKDILQDAFYAYDSNGNGQLDRHECYVFFRDFHEAISDEDMQTMFKDYDTDKSGFISLNEFIGLAYALIKAQESRGMNTSSRRATANQLAQNAFADAPDEEEEDIPEEFTALSPEAQQLAIKRKAFLKLAIGTGLVVLFSDGMVDVINEIANRFHMNPFYVSFVLAPLASNASEVIASMYYASKKTRKTITVSLTALEGAASMNNTFCLSIFMGLIFFRGLAWQYTAETVAIVTVQMVLGVLVQSTHMTLGRAVFVLAIFPLSIVFVACLEALGFD